MLRLVLVIAFLATEFSVGCDGGEEGNGHLDAATDGGFDADDDTGGDSHVDGGGTGDAGHDSGPVDDPPRDVCDDPPLGDEVCGNCVDEDGDGTAEWCRNDEIYLTPQVVSPGEALTVRACTRADPAYSCVDVVCTSCPEAVRARFVDARFQMGYSCWEYEARLPSAGEWTCTFRRTSRVDERCSDAAGADDRACGSVEVSE